MNIFIYRSIGISCNRITVAYLGIVFKRNYVKILAIQVEYTIR